mgnify:FL=1
MPVPDGAQPQRGYIPPPVFLCPTADTGYQSGPVGGKDTAGFPGPQSEYAALLLFPSFKGDHATPAPFPERGQRGVVFLVRAEGLHLPAVGIDVVNHVAPAAFAALSPAALQLDVAGDFAAFGIGHGYEAAHHPDGSPSIGPIYRPASGSMNG